MDRVEPKLERPALPGYTRAMKSTYMWVMVVEALIIGALWLVGSIFS
ncbi:MAG TPA: hypothetical protein VJK49_00715 [Candidatus Limnocylindrales bacterium]|nr:hypothetical protein [Candidatus Limnocylindrales bacterium]